LNSAKKVEEERKNLVVKLTTMLNNPKVTDNELEPIITRIGELCDQISKIGLCQLKQLITPSTISYLSSVGFFQQLSAQVEEEKYPGSVKDFCDKIHISVPNLSQNQLSSMVQEAIKHYEKLEILRHERNILAAELEDTAFKTSVRTTEESLRGIIESTAKLELLRNNLEQESSMWETTLDVIFDVLTPRQKGEFYVSADFKHRSVEQLKVFYEHIKKTDKKLIY